MILENYRVQFITHCNNQYSYSDSARIALEGGCKWIQLRMKDAEDSILEETARNIQRMCKEHDATFIIDDHVWLAKKIAADGVHLGKNDMPIAQARKILGYGSIIGCTVNSFDDILATLKESTPDYFGCGPFRYTSTKANLAPILGIEGYKEICTNLQKADLQIPLIAIGGICTEDIPALFDCGIDGIALSSSIINATNPISEMSTIIKTINKYYNQNNFSHD